MSWQSLSVLDFCSHLHVAIYLEESVMRNLKIHLHVIIYLEGSAEEELEESKKNPSWTPR